jgi:outer membrane protein assembly factor BamE (lipoprotein component of BamABCDE complex)
MNRVFNMHAPRRWLPALLLVALLTGCATPAARIRQNPDLFATFSPEAQTLIRQGRIEPGFTQDMVRMALGEPDRRYMRRTQISVTEVWSYTDYYTTIDRQRVQAQFRYRDPRGGIRTATDQVWVDVQQKNEFEKLRVEFDGDVVKAMESVER